MRLLLAVLALENGTGRTAGIPREEVRAPDQEARDGEHERNDQIMICVSRARSGDLVIDR